MTIPAAVAKAEEAADRAMEEIQRQSEQPVETPVAAEVPATEAPVLPETAQSETPAEVVSEPAPVETVSAAEYKKTKAALATLQGKYNAEVRRTQAENRQLLEQMKALESKLDSIQSVQPSKPATPAYLKYVRPEEVEGADSTVLDLQGRIAKGAAEDVLSKFQPKPESNANEQALVELRAIRDRATWAEVEKLRHGSKLLNDTDATFNDWLKTVDVNDVDGRSYEQIGSIALARENVNAIVRIIDAYCAETGAELAEPAEAKAAKLERMAKPSSARTPSQHRAPQKPVYKASDFKALSIKYAREQGQMSPKQRQEIEAKLEEMEAAAYDNRMIQDAV